MEKFIFSTFLYVLLACGQSTNAVPETAQGRIENLAVQADSIDRDYLLGKFNPAGRKDFVKVPSPYSEREKMMLRSECFEAFKKMHAAAAKDGIKLLIISSTRTFSQQKAIWEGKWERFAAEAPDPEARARKILEYSSMPGSSRHHWGTDIDLNDLNNPAFEAGGKHEKVYLWLQEHAAEFGFCQPYTAGRPYGYHEEKWHWTYTPLSSQFLKTWRENIDDSDITGFKGAEMALAIGIKKHYVLGIAEACQ
jgi:zinc D-Ala-D-Ala carboxypeptidase